MTGRERDQRPEAGPVEPGAPPDLPAADRARGPDFDPGGRVHRWLSHGLQAVMAVGLVLSLLDARWMNAAIVTGILFLTLLPLVVERRYDVYIPTEFELAAAVFVFASLFLGWTHGYYLRFGWWDAVLHAISGVLLGLLGFLLVYVLNQEEEIGIELKPGFVAFFAFTFALAAGALWEIFEFAMDSWFGGRMQTFGLVDTMWDLILDGAAALLVALAGYLYIRSGTESPLTEWFEEFVRRNPRLFPEANG